MFLNTFSFFKFFSLVSSVTGGVCVEVKLMTIFQCAMFSLLMGFYNKMILMMMMASTTIAAAASVCGGVMFTVLYSIYIMPYTPHIAPQDEISQEISHSIQRERKEGKRAYLYKKEQKTKIGDPTRPQQYYHCTTTIVINAATTTYHNHCTCKQLIIVNSNLRKRENWKRMAIRQTNKRQELALVKSMLHNNKQWFLTKKKREELLQNTTIIIT